MKSKSIPLRIQIPEPCSQSWDQMTPEGRGRHCAACAQTVTDFTRMTDAQILEVLRGSAGGCGRFREDQLGRELIVPAAERRFSLAPFYKIAASLMLVFSAGKIVAQKKPGEAIVRFPENVTHEEYTDRKRFISGVVIETDGEPLIGVQIRLTNAKFMFLGGAMTGIDGEFKCEIPSNISPSESLQLTVQYLGYITDTISIAQSTISKPFNIALSQYISSRRISIEEEQVYITGGYMKPLIDPAYFKNTEEQVGPLDNKELKTGKTRIKQPKKWWQFWKHTPKRSN